MRSVSPCGSDSFFVRKEGSLQWEFPVSFAVVHLATFIQSRVDTAGPANLIKQAWDRLSPLPGGKLLFSRLVGRLAPYTGTIHASVEELAEGYCRTHMEDRPSTRNHLRSVHAIALANLSELTGNLALAYSLPDDAQFIVAGMSIDYLKKARGRITGHSECPMIKSSATKEYEVPVTLSDQQGDLVVRATLRTLVGPKSRG